MSEEDIKLLEDDGWVVECEHPLEIRFDDGGSFAMGLAAQIVLDDIKHEKNCSFTEQNMNDCFNAGVNRGITMVSFIVKNKFSDEFPNYKEYMKRFEEEK